MERHDVVKRFQDKLNIQKISVFRSQTSKEQSPIRSPQKARKIKTQNYI